jgi:hypothetical protein
VIDADDGDPSFGLDAVEIEAIDPAGYTDEIMSDRFGTCPPQIKIKPTSTSILASHRDRWVWVDRRVQD